MRIRWRGLELPSRVTRDDNVSTESYGRFVAEPFEHGFGTTIGNSLRRILLSSIEGSTVTTVKIAGVSHEFCAMDGVIEDVTDIILNIKGIQVTLDSDETKTMRIRRDTAGVVTAADIEADPAITIANPDLVIATLTDDVQFHVDFTVRRGRGFVPAIGNRSAEQELGVIPIDSIYSPVVRVRYRTEEMRVGQKTNYDRLIMEIWTRGTTKPEDALVEAGTILRKHLSPFIMYNELGDEMVAAPTAEPEAEAVVDGEQRELLDKPASFLNLSVRASNCLEQAHITTIGDLVTRTEADLLRVRSFGKTSLHEVLRKLTELNLSLGMRVGPDGTLVPGPVSSEIDFSSMDGDANDVGDAPFPESDSTFGAQLPDPGGLVTGGLGSAFGGTASPTPPPSGPFSPPSGFGDEQGSSDASQVEETPPIGEAGPIGDGGQFEQRPDVDQPEAPSEPQAGSIGDEQPVADDKHTGPMDAFTMGD